MLLTNLFETTLRDKEDLTAKRQALQDLSMNKDVDQKAVQQRKLDLEREAEKKGLNENRLSVGDPIVVTAPNEFEGATGEIANFSPSGKFVIVDLYNHGKHSMHLSDVAYNDYADKQDADEFWDEDDGVMVEPPKRPGHNIYKEEYNTYDIENKPCPKCYERELTYFQGTNYIKCGACGKSFKLSGRSVDESKNLAKRVRVVAGDHAGKTGTIRQIKTGAFKGAPKTYFVDLDDGSQADNLSSKALRLIKDQGVAEGSADGLGVEQRAELEAKLKELEARFDPDFQYSDDYSFWSRQNEIKKRINSIKKQLEQGVAEEIEKTATGLRHRAQPDVYGGAEHEPNPLRTLDKPGTNRIEKVLGVKFDREKKYQGGVDLGDQELDEVSKDTLGRYLKLAGVDVANRASASSYQSGAAGDTYNKADPSRQEHSREQGIDRAIKRLTK